MPKTISQVSATKTFLFSACRKCMVGLLLASLAACSTATTYSGEDDVTGADTALQMATPEEVGIDSKRLDRVTQAMQNLVDEGRLAGVITLAARDNKIFHFESVGQRDIGANLPMTPDTIFRIYSMSKPITGVALMILFEEGKFKLSDPVEKYLPEFANQTVYVGEDANGQVLTERADHPMTIRELMNHTAGFAYSSFANDSPVDAMYSAVNMFDPNSSLQDMGRKLSQIPLLYQPGTRWHYSLAVDVQGYLVEALSGQRFGDFLEDRLFGPLGMDDSAFYVPEDKRDRFSQVYVYGPNGELIAEEAFDGIIHYLEDQKLQAGGWGMVSTAMDYLRFAQMLQNRGVLDGVRILSPTTIKLMRTDQLPEGVTELIGRPGNSFGLDFAIVEDPVEAESYSKGEYYWGGAAGTWFWIDPVENVTFVGMIQQFSGAGHTVPEVRGISRRALYQALVEPHSH